MKNCGAARRAAVFFKQGQTAQRTGTPAWGAPLPGGIYASPTNKGTAYTNQKRCREANVPGPHTCGPYNARGTTGKPCTGSGARLTAGSRSPR